jgi:hypothetical protein
MRFFKLEDVLFLFHTDFKTFLETSSANQAEIISTNETIQGESKHSLRDLYIVLLVQDIAIQQQKVPDDQQELKKYEKLVVEKMIGEREKKGEKIVPSKEVLQKAKGDLDFKCIVEIVASSWIKKDEKTRFLEECKKINGRSNSSWDSDMTKIIANKDFKKNCIANLDDFISILDFMAVLKLQKFLEK